MKKILIANRGEIAVRIIRACTDAGLSSVAVYAEDDLDALHTRLADEAYALGGRGPAESYLNADAILDAARRSGADAIHPGYGFLSESAPFARAVEAAGLTWIGPSPESIELLGDKVSARRLAASVGAPLVPGTPDPVADAAEVRAFAADHGLPVVIKAAFGGGGRGMRVAWATEDLDELFAEAQGEAIAAFGRGECFVERFLDRPRHIEAQVLADAHGGVVVVGTRDCSLQRRNQKLVEESPAPFLSDEQRTLIHRSAADICRAAGYRGAGTVEFLLGIDGTISFLEVNTRLQVEHPITEETSGVDLVAEQFRIAAGEPLQFTETPEPRGHAFEFRINAEDPARGFLPTPGPVTLFHAPGGPGVRVDAGVETGSIVPGVFDSLLAKLIVTGATRDEALARARRALAEFRVEGVATVLPFHRAVVADPAFAEDFAVHTRWIETEFAAELTPAPRPEPITGGLQRTSIEIDGRRHDIAFPAGFLAGAGTAAPSEESSAARPTDAELTAAHAGTLVSWAVAEGDTVQAGDHVAVLEAMKMQAPVLAHRTGTIRSLRAVGSVVAAEEALAQIEG